MLERARRAMNYWMFAVSHPGYVLETAQRDQHRVRISFYMIFAFSLLSALSAWTLWRAGRLPLMDSWVPFVSPGYQYLYQAAWTVPWFIITYLAIAGLIYMATALSGKEAFFEDALMISALSIAIPYLMFWWIPDTFLLPAMGAGTSLRWPELFELERKFLFPAIWQFALISFGMRKVNNTNRAFCLLGASIAILAFFALYLPFMR